MPLVLAGATSGQATVQATDAQTVTLTLPASSGTLVVTGGAQTIEFADGSASAPSITNSGDTNTGIFFPAADTIAFTEGGVESMRINASGSVGIGTASPNDKLDVNGADAFIRVDRSNGEPGITMRYNGSSTNRGDILVTSGGAMYFTAGGSTERMRIDSAGNVGIGTSSPRVKLDISGSVLVNGYQTSSTYAPLSIKTTASVTTPSTFTNAINIWNSTTVGDYSNITFGYNTLGLTNAPAYIGFVSTNQASNGFGDLVFGTRSVSTDTAATERMRISSDGGVYIGTTVAPSGSTGGAAFISSTNSRRVLITATTSTTSNRLVEFENPNGTVGNIATSGSGTTYSTSSDYRLKEDIAPMTGALATVQALKPVTYKWKVDGSDGQGFIAHELQAVVPECVTGEKDGMRMEQYEATPAIPATYDEEGNELTSAVEAVMDEREVPEYQGIDTSFLVATLTAAIQEQQAIITDLKARIETLENT
jgi:hypothetical protein